MTLAYGLYMAEAENRFPKERQYCISLAIKDFIALKQSGKNPNNYITAVLAKYNLKECQLSATEIQKINETVKNN